MIQVYCSLEILVSFSPGAEIFLTYVGRKYSLKKTQGATASGGAYGAAELAQSHLPRLLKWAHATQFQYGSSPEAQ